MGSFGPFTWGREREIKALRKEVHRLRMVAEGDYEDDDLYDLRAEIGRIRHMLEPSETPTPTGTPGDMGPIPVEAIMQVWNSLGDWQKSLANGFIRLKYGTSFEQLISDPAKLQEVITAVVKENPWILGKRAPQQQPQQPQPQQAGSYEVPH